MISDWNASRSATERTHQTERTDFGRKGGGGTDFTSRSPQVDDLDLVGVLYSEQNERAAFQ